MKKILTITLLLFIAGVAFSQNCEVKQSDYSQIKISFSSPEITVKNISFMGHHFSTLTMNEFATQSISGKPALPSMVKTIEVPLGTGLQYEVVSITLDTIDGNTLGISNPVVPAQPSRSKSDRSTRTLVKDEVLYATDAFYGEPTISIEEIGIARNRNLATVTFNPIKWNPSTNQVIVTKKVTIAIHQRNADIEATTMMKRLYASPEFGLGTEVINSLGNINSTKEARISAPIRYTIVANSMFRGALDEFAAWKRRKGFMVDLVYTDESNVGSTTTSIRNYLRGLYTNATESAPAPTYVLLVGDVAQLPAFQTYTSNSHYSDLNYVCWTDGDNIPDCYIGRFSAQNLEQLEPQISKTLMYEQYTFPDDSYLNKAVLIAGVDGGSAGDFGYTHADPTMDYIAKNYVNAANGFTNVTYYKNNTSSHPVGVTVSGSSQSNSTASALRTLYNGGCGLVNYSAHGDETLWAHPELTVSHVEQMTNNNKPIIAIGNCCLSNSFQISTCLGEAFLRKANNAGGVAYIGASEVTYWDEDVYWSMGPRTNISASMNLNYTAGSLGMYDQLFHSHDESIDAWHITMGAMLFAGNMAVQNSSTSTTMKKYYWEIYHLMGDPSLMPYIHGQAPDMSLNAPNNVPIGNPDIDIQCPPYTYLALTDQEHNLIAATYADANGNATLNLSNQDIVTGEYELAAWAQGYRQQFQTITIAPTDTYIKAVALNPQASMVAGQHTTFDLTIQNIGVQPADSIWIEFRSTNDNMLIESTNTTLLTAGLNPNEDLTIPSACSVLVWNDVADQSIATVNVITRWGHTERKRSINRFNFTIAAPLFHVTSSTLHNDTITITSINDGHATLENASATLLSLDPTISVTATTGTFSLTPGETITLDYTFTTNTDAPINRVVPMLYSIESNDFHFTDSILVIFGNTHEIIDFETGSWGDYSWTNNIFPWEITSTVAYEGSYCARSKNWNGNGDRKSSELTLAISTPIDDSISFYYRVSSEEDYDLFNFYLDGNEVLEASGEVEWTRAAYPVTAGTHTLKFSYSKDWSMGEGEDAAYIDNITIPKTGTAYIYINDTTCLGSNYTFLDTTISANDLAEGTQQFSRQVDELVYYLTLTVAETPQVAILGSDTTIVAGEAVRLSATVSTSNSCHYLWSTGETHPIINAYPTTTTTYSVTAYNGRCSSEASTTITVEPNPFLCIDNDSQLSTLNSQLFLFPNPANDKLTIEGSDIRTITITDIMGRAEFFSTQQLHNTTTSQLTIDISNLPNGIHIIQATTSDGTKLLKKFIKK